MGALADALVSKGGYNRTDAENAERGPRVADLTREFLGGSSSSGGGASGSTDYAEIARKQLELQKEANKPAIETLNASKASAAAAYAPARSSIADEYDKLLASVKGQVSTNTSREFGKRGIPLSSGMFDETLLEKTRPLEETNTANKAAELARMDLAYNDQQSGFDKLVAQLQAGGSSDALNQAMQILSSNQQSQQMAFAAEQAAQDRAWQEKVFNLTTLPESQYAINKPYPSTGGNTTGATNPFLTNTTQQNQSPASPNFKPMASSYGAFGRA